MTERMQTLIVSLRVVIAMFSFNVGLAYAVLVLGHAGEIFFPIIGILICACAWFVVEWQIKRERNVER